MRLRFAFIGIIVGLVIFGTQLIAGQEQGIARNLSYGEVVGGVFDRSDSEPHQWQFPGNEREMVHIHVQRTGGQFTPHIQLQAPDGTVLTPDAESIDNDIHSVDFTIGFSKTGTYGIKVSGTGLENTTVENIGEYSLTLQYMGLHRAASDEGLTPLPTLGINDFPELMTSSSRYDENINLTIYGNAQTTEPDPIIRRHYYTVQSPSHSVDLYNANPLSLGIDALSFLDDGVGVIRKNEGGQFFTDQNIIGLTHLQSITTIKLANGQQISTDFYGITSIQAVDGLVVLNMVGGQRIIFSGQHFDFRRRGGVNGDGSNAAPVNEFRLDNNNIITTDMLQWQTLSYLPSSDSSSGIEVRVVYNNDIRFISDIAKLDIFESGDSARPQLTEDEDIRFIEIRVNKTRGELDITIDPTGMGDVVVQNGSLAVYPLDGREIIDSLDSTQILLIEDLGIRYKYTDGSYRLSLPDRTEITTPATITTTTGALPYDTGFTPSGFNNLGTSLFDYRPRVNLDHVLLPINRVNGNFNYSVQDFDIPSHTLKLEWVRHYNSQSPAGSLTPAYILDSPAEYLFRNMGQGWRHSYQYDLDVTYAPLGQIRLILPDGSTHIFSKRGNSYLSLTMLSWAIHQVNGVTGHWQATTSEGDIYLFDRAGRIQRITNADELSLLFSLATREALTATSHQGGFFITEPYGRRLEIYTDYNNMVISAVGPSKREITYDYDGTLLALVRYIDSDLSAVYNYNDDNLLSGVLDNTSPYHQNLRIEYDEIYRVTRYVENPQGERDGLSRITTMDYRQSAVNVETEIVNSRELTSRWIYDERSFLIRHETPKAGWAYSYEYNWLTQRLTQYGQPDLTQYFVNFNNWGYLTQFTDPNPVHHSLAYEIFDENRVLLTEITYPSTENGQPSDTFTYDENHRLIGLSQLVETTPERVERNTAYYYDEMGRLATIVAPGPNGEAVETNYSYGIFGYVERINQSIEGQTISTIHLRHNMLGHLVSIIDGRGNTLNITWDDKRDIVTRAEMAEFVISYTYDEFGNVTHYEYGDAARDYTYNSLNQVITMTNPLGRITTYTYDEHDNILSVILPDQRDSTYVYTYDELDNLTSITSPGGFVTEYNTDLDISSSRTRNSVTDPNGDVRRFVYDPMGRIRDILYIDNRQQQTYRYELTYDLFGNLTQVEEGHVPAGRALHIEYDLLGQPLGTSINDVSTSYSYNSAGNMETVTSPGGGAISYYYDLLSDSVVVTLPDGDRETYRYDENDNLIEFVDTQGNRYSYIYDELDRLKKVIHPDGGEIDYDYDARGNLISATNERGATIYAEYNLGDYPINTEDAVGNSTRYEYNEMGQLVKIIEPLGLTTDFAYDREGHIVAETLPSNREMLYSYDSLGRLVSETNALGYTTFYTYNNIDRLSRIIDPLGNEKRYTWSSSGRMIHFINANYRSYEYVTNALGWLTQITDKASGAEVGTNFFFDYDAEGNITAIRLGTSDSSYQYTYTSDGQIATFSDPSMDANNPWRFYYDELGRLTFATDPTGSMTFYEYDTVGNITRIGRAVGTEAQTQELFEYDPAGNVKRYTAPGGTVSEFTYNQNNRVTQRIDRTIDGTERQYIFEYNELDYLSFIFDPNGNQTTYTHDQFGNLIRVSHILDDGEETAITYSYTYDEMDNLIEIRLPEEQVISMTYNALNKQVRFVDALVQAWAYTYDRIGNLTQISDPLGSSVSYEYDQVGRIVEIEYPDGGVVNLRYDDNGNLNNVISPPNREGDFETREISRERIIYLLDSNGQLREIQHGAQERILFERDDLGRITAMTDAKEQTTYYIYDGLGRITTIVSPDNNNIYRSYDDMGNIALLTNANDSFSYIYDGFGNMRNFQTNTLSIDYTYDAVGNILSQDAGQFGEISYTYDSLYRPVRIEKDGTGANITYNNNGWRSSITRDNGSATNFDYYDNGLIKWVSHRNSEGEQVDRLNYSYDPAGNIIRIIRMDSWTVLYSYNSVHQLISERWLNPNNETSYTLTYFYDKSGNRIERTMLSGQSHPERTLYVYNNKNQLIEEFRDVNIVAEQRLMLFIGFLIVGAAPLIWRKRHTPRMFKRLSLVVVALPLMGLSVSFQEQNNPSIFYDYDINGNLTEMTYDDEHQGSLLFEYDPFNRLLSVRGVNYEGQAVDVSVDYDALGRISHMKLLDVQYHLVYDANGLIGVENITEGTMESYLFDMSGELLRIDGPDSTTWTLHDALGSARKLLNADGTLVDDKVGYNYDAFGSIITPYDGQGEAYDIAIEPQILFAGQLYEPISGMYFMGVRAYDPQLGRFIQRDPVRHDPQGTLYTYAYNRPGVYIDPNGMSPMSPHREAGAIRFPQDTYPASDPPSLTEEIPFIPTVAELQADENHRVLEASYEARFMINDFVAAVDPALCDFYLRGLNPIPDDVRDIMGQPLQEINNLYTSETGWQLTSTPDPTRNIDIFAIIDTVTPLLRQAQNGVNSVQMTGCNDYWILPQPSTPEELINSSQKQESFAQTLNEVSMVQTIPYQFELLTSLPDSIMPNPLSTILLQDVPQRDVGNELPKELRNLQTQTAEFYLSTIFLSGMGAENATYTNNHVEDILPPMPQSTDSRDH